MSESEQIICDICKKPIEAREDLTVAMAFSRELRPFHTECYSNALRVPISDSGFWKYGFVVNRGLWPLLSQYGFHVLAFLFILDLVLRHTVTGYYYSFAWLLIIAAFMLLLFTFPYLVWKKLIKRKKDKSWELYESKLPEHLSGTGQIPCEICKEPIVSRNDLLVMIPWNSRYVPMHPRCYIEILKSPKIRYLKIHHRARWERYSPLIPVIIVSTLAIWLSLIWRDFSGTPYQIGWPIVLTMTSINFYRSYRWFKREAERSWKEYESKLPEK